MLLIIFNISQILRLCLLHDVSMIWTQYLQNFNGNKMTEKTMFKSIKSRPSSLKKITFSEKTEQRAVTQFAQTSEKNSRDSTFLKQSEKNHMNVSRSLVFLWHIRLSGGRENIMGDVREGRPSFRNCRAVQNEVIRMHVCWFFKRTVRDLFLHTHYPMARRKILITIAM